MKRLIILTICLITPISAWATVVKPTQVEMEFQIQIAYDGSGNVEYVCKSLEPCASDEACWQIRKLTYSGSNVTGVLWANGSHSYDFACDSRTGYTYSV